MPSAAKGGRSASKAGKRPTPATTSSKTSSAPSSSMPEGQDPKERMKELKTRAIQDGERLQKAFWANLDLASKESDKTTIGKEQKERLAVGSHLKSKEESESSLAMATESFEAQNFESALSELNTIILSSHLEESILGRLYHLRGKVHYHLKHYMESIRDLSFAKSLFVEANGDTLFYRLKCYLDLHLYNYAKLDYDALVDEFPEYPNIKAYKSKVSGPMPHDFQKLLQKISSGGSLPPSTSRLDLVKVTIVVALAQEFDFEELGKFLFLIKTSGYSSIKSPLEFGLYLRDVFAATDMEDISEVFTHFIPEHEVPIECQINEVMDALQSMGQDCHLIHRIGYAMCFSLAWTPLSMWNLHATLFPEQVESRFPLQRALWKEYFEIEMDRIKVGDSDVSYTCNGGIGELPPPHLRVDYLYATDHGASDYVRLHATATAHKRTEVLEELARHVPLNTFHVTLAPMIFATARDAMPLSTKFIIERGADVHIMDAAEETPIDAAKIALEFRTDMLHDFGQIVPAEDFASVIQILRDVGAKESEEGESEARAAFDQMFGHAESDEEEFGMEGEEDGEEYEEM